ncbi:restriction endonuclease [Dyella sp. A6]|uniref:restriction endonuclease n=1 Tax=Dyella aluminiiresistens TaxID=3069105 RepID=UPI002E78EEF5|nr:restriction endonuclease [Dyella sp. A6]
MILMRWPIGLLAGLAACAGVHYGFHSGLALMPTPAPRHDTLAWWLLGGCWFLTLCTSPGYQRRRHRKVLHEQLDQLAGMPQPVFEEAVIEAFHRRGYVLEDNLRTEHGDLAELLLYRNGTTLLVSCRNWRRRVVDADAVRMLPEWMAQQHAHSARLLAIGDYDDTAWKLVVGQPIELIHGESLLAMLHEAQMPPPPNLHKFTRTAQRRNQRHQALRIVH